MLGTLLPVMLVVQSVDTKAKVLDGLAAHTIPKFLASLWCLRMMSVNHSQEQNRFFLSVFFQPTCFFQHIKSLFLRVGGMIDYGGKDEGGSKKSLKGRLKLWPRHAKIGLIGWKEKGVGERTPHSMNATMKRTFENVWDHRTFNDRKLVFFPLESKVTWLSQWRCDSVFFCDMRLPNGDDGDQGTAASVIKALEDIGFTCLDAATTVMFCHPDGRGKNNENTCGGMWSVLSKEKRQVVFSIRREQNEQKHWCYFLLAKVY